MGYSSQLRRRGAKAGGTHRSRAGELRRRLLRWVETGCLVAGGSLLLASLTSVAQSELRHAQALRLVPDMQTWSEGARARYRAAAARQGDTALAVLRVPDADLEVPVYASYSDLNLDRGSAIIDGMAYPQELGHIGIAGHRDGYFRSLQDLAVGATITLESAGGAQRYIVDDLRVVNPEELAWLQETDTPRLTLVTCYPFHYVGDAPQRYLVRAAPVTPPPAQR